MVGMMLNILYKTQVMKIWGLNVVGDGTLSHFWHKRLAYLSERKLLIFWQGYPLFFVPKGKKLSLFDPCLFGKHHRVSFSKTSKVKENTLDVVYSDVCNVIELESLGGSRYFTIIDDVSRKV